MRSGADELALFVAGFGGLMTANALPLDAQKKIVQNVLASDKDEMVRLYATGMQEIAQMISEQPAGTTQPSTSPAVPVRTAPPGAPGSPAPSGANK